MSERRTDDELLVESGTDPSAFAEFYRRNLDTVLGFFYRRTGCAHTSADLTAETFAQALASVARFRPERAPATAWLIGIARNQLRYYLRRQRTARSARARLRMPVEVELLGEEQQAIEDRFDAALQHGTLESDLTRAATSGAAPVRRTPSLAVRRVAVLAAALVLVVSIPVVTSVVLSLLDDDGLPQATADLPITGGDIEVVPDGRANTYFDVELTTAPQVAQSVRVPEPTRVVAVEVDLHPPTVLELDGTQRFAPDGPSIPGTISVSLWQAGAQVDLDGEVELRADFARMARGTREAPIPRNSRVRIELDAPTVLSAGHYLVVVGFEVDPDQRVLRMGVGGALDDVDDLGDRYPDGQAFRAVDRGDDRLWFQPHESSREEDGLPSRGDLQLWLRVR